MWSIIDYTYRDAANYKIQLAVAVEGQFSQEQSCRLSKCLTPDGQFIPRQVGLREVRFPDSPTEDDVPWFEMGIINENDNLPSNTPVFQGTPEDLTCLFEEVAAVGWDDALNPETFTSFREGERTIPGPAPKLKRMHAEELVRRENLCDECMSELCVFAREGMCRFPLISGESPKTGPDGCFDCVVADI